ncbi:MAG: hypothetical protein Q7K03_11550, partial [Dehalococcoidia bacterium]|nr:hypothetical protein [Dehalococcoidia bacterium]
TVIGAVTLSPGAMVLKVIRAVVGLVEMSTVSVLKVLAATDAVSVNRASVATRTPADKIPIS